jgi:hypothetical protein
VLTFENNYQTCESYCRLEMVSDAHNLVRFRSLTITSLTNQSQ